MGRWQLPASSRDSWRGRLATGRRLLVAVGGVAVLAVGLVQDPSPTDQAGREVRAVAEDRDHRRKLCRLADLAQRQIRRAAVEVSAGGSSAARALAADAGGAHGRSRPGRDTAGDDRDRDPTGGPSTVSPAPGVHGVRPWHTTVDLPSVDDDRLDQTPSTGTHRPRATRAPDGDDRPRTPGRDTGDDDVGAGERDGRASGDDRPRDDDEDAAEATDDEAAGTGDDGPEREDADDRDTDDRDTDDDGVRSRRDVDDSDEE